MKEQLPSNEIAITCDGLAGLLKAAEHTGTVHQWCVLALEWAAKADAEIRRLRNLSPDETSAEQRLNQSIEAVAQVLQEEAEGLGLDARGLANWAKAAERIIRMVASSPVTTDAPR